MRSPNVPLNTDDRTLLEFAFARNMRMTHGDGFETMRRDARLFAADRPAGTDAFDWASVETQRLGMFVASDNPPQPGAAASREQRLLVAALGAYVKDNLAGAWDDWQRLLREPRGLVELVMVAECLAEAGNPAALPYLRALEKINRPQAEAIQASLLWRQ